MSFFITNARSTDPFVRDPFLRNTWQIYDPSRDDILSSLTNQQSSLLSSDILETETEFKILADLPGVSAQDLELTVEGSTLLMKAERKHTHENKTDKYHSLERSYGKVQRRFKLPKNADLANASTRFKDGVLTVSVRKIVEKPPSPTKLTVNYE